MAISSSLVNKLARVPLFQNLGPAELEELALMCTRKKFSPDSKFTFSEDEESAFCIVNQGKAIVKSQDATGQGETVVELEPGDFFGETSAIDNEPFAYDIFAGSEEVELALFTRKDFLDVLQNYPSIHLALSREFCRRLRAVNNKSTNISLPASVRIGRVLIAVATKQGTIVNEGIILPRLTQEEVSKLSDTPQESINEAFAELKTAGLIKPTETKQVLVTDKNKLEAWVRKRSE